MDGGMNVCPYSHMKDYMKYHKHTAKTHNATIPTHHPGLDQIKEPHTKLRHYTPNLAEYMYYIVMFFITYYIHFPGC